MTKSLLDAAKDNPLLARVLTAQGTDGVYTTMTQFLAAAATAYVVSAVLRVYSDEESGLGEAVLAGAVSRWRWLLTAVASALVGSIVLMFFAGLGNGLGAGITVGEPETILRLTLAGLAYVPAMAVIAGVAALAVAVRHGWIGWLAVTFVVTSLYLGALLRLPRWLIDLSPVGRTTAPSHYSVGALTVMVVVAAALTLRRLDLSQPRRNLKRGDREARYSNTGVKLYRACPVRRVVVHTRRHFRLLASVAVHRRVRRRVGRPHRLPGGEGSGSASAAHARRPDSGNPGRAKDRQLVHVAVVSGGDGDQRGRPPFRVVASPAAVSLLGDVVVAVGIAITFAVIIQNGYAAANITVEADQKVVSTGLYGLVRHPMYVGILIILVGTPVALGSYWGLLVLVPATFTFAFRIVDEEKMLTEELDGYLGYTRDVHYRLMPFVW